LLESRQRFGPRPCQPLWKPAGNATLAITAGEQLGIRFTAGKRNRHTPALRRIAKHAQKQSRHFLIFCLKSHKTSPWQRATVDDATTEGFP
jgi:hypothetical protein